MSPTISLSFSSFSNLFLFIFFTDLENVGYHSKSNRSRIKQFLEWWRSLWFIHQLFFIFFFPDFKDIEVSGENYCGLTPAKGSLRWRIHSADGFTPAIDFHSVAPSQLPHEMIWEHQWPILALLHLWSSMFCIILFLNPLIVKMYLWINPYLLIVHFNLPHNYVKSLIFWLLSFSLPYFQNKQIYFDFIINLPIMHSNSF